MRLDRFITLGIVRPLQRLGLWRVRHGLPILMYHSISDDLEADVHPYYRVCTSPRRFAEQMAWLARNGWQGVTLSAGLDWLNRSKSESCRTKAESGKPLPVALTFDDGFRDFYTAAFPVLQRYGFSATMYLPTAFIGESRRTFAPPRASTARDCLTWSEVREMRKAAIEFGSHTVNHSTLSELAWPAIETEVGGSKTAIESALGEPIGSFAHPYAFPQEIHGYASRLSELLRGAGYRSAVTTRIGRAHHEDEPLTLRRLPANGLDDERLLLAKLAGAYDWLGSVQAAVRQSKRLARRGRRSRPTIAGGKGQPERCGASPCKAEGASSTSP